MAHEHQLASLVDESIKEGFHFLERLLADIRIGRFLENDSEMVFLALSAGEVIGVGALTSDPYNPYPGVGRARRVYVSASRRKEGVGRTLLESIVVSGRHRYEVLSLRAVSEDASGFYDHLGWLRTEEPKGESDEWRLGRLSDSTHWWQYGGDTIANSHMSEDLSK